MKVIISDRANRNIHSIFEYSYEYSLKYANETIDNIYSIIFYLENSPYLGRYVPELSNKNYLEVFYKSYRIVYSVYEKSKIIYIHFIVHAKRDFQSVYNFYIQKDYDSSNYQ